MTTYQFDEGTRRSWLLLLAWWLGVWVVMPTLLRAQADLDEQVRQDNPLQWRCCRKKGLMVILVLLATTLAFAAANAASQTTSVDQVLAALGEGPALGPPQASVTIIEFSDFQCSFCKKFWAETLPRLKETYIKPGRVRFVYRHLAILGEHSVQAALAAECAGEQGRFWEYHDKLFAAQGALAFVRTRLLRYAQELDLDVETFGQCLESANHAQKVEGETRVGRLLGARGTPTFFINGRLLIGAHPFETFEAVIQELEKASVPGRSSPSQREGQGR